MSQVVLFCFWLATWIICLIISISASNQDNCRGFAIFSTMFCFIFWGVQAFITVLCNLPY